MFKTTAVMLLLAATPAAAQIQSRPTDPPLVTAVNESWYRLREPIQFAGDLYYPAGPTVFFNGNVMVRTGHYNGVPLYADTTLEPYSMVLVPVSRGQLQPYERRRSGDLAGTTASRAPSFPVGSQAERALPQAPTAPTAAPRSTGAIVVSTPETGVASRDAGSDRPVGTAGRITAPAALERPVGTTGVARRVPATPSLTSLRRPEGNDGVWMQFAGAKWVSAGPAIPRAGAEYRIVGQHGGFPVLARADRENTIYLPAGAGLLAPYRLK
jgi:hypothetical protein